MQLSHHDLRLFLLHCEPSVSTSDIPTPNPDPALRNSTLEIFYYVTSFIAFAFITLWPIITFDYEAPAENLNQ